MQCSTLWIVTLLLISAPSALSQTPPTDSQTLQAILAELRQLHHDLQTSSAMAARAQIALYRLQRENEAVARAMQRVSDADHGLLTLRTHEATKRRLLNRIALWRTTSTRQTNNRTLKKLSFPDSSPNSNCCKNKSNKHERSKRKPNSNFAMSKLGSTDSMTCWIVTTMH